MLCSTSRKQKTTTNIYDSIPAAGKFFSIYYLWRGLDLPHMPVLLSQFEEMVNWKMEFVLCTDLSFQPSR